MIQGTAKRILVVGVLALLMTGAASCDYNRDRYRDYYRDRDRYNRHYGRERDWRNERDSPWHWRDRDRRDWSRDRRS